MSEVTSECQDWRDKAYRCVGSQSHHDLIPIAKTKTEKMEQVTMLMCQKCFHTLNTDEIWKHRQDFKNL